MNSNFYKLLLPIVACACVHAQSEAYESAIKIIRTELFKNRGYDPMALPVKNISQSVPVEISITLIKIFDLDINLHTMTVEGWFWMTWKDQHLAWNPQNYSGVNVIRVHPQEVFTPDIMLYNAADLSLMKDNMIKTNVLLYSSGELFWIPPVVLKFFCDMDLSNWPYDEQTCSMTFGSWTHDGLSLDLKLHSNKLGTQDYWPSQEWDLVATNAKTNVIYYDCCPEPYPSVTFNMTVRRRTSLYHYTIFLPVTTAVIISLLSFWFSVRSPTRFLMSLTALVSLIIVVLYLGSRFALATDTIPYSMKYMGRVIMLIGLTLVWSTVAHNLIDLKLQLPEAVKRVTTPAHRFVLIEADNGDGLALANDETIGTPTKKERSPEVLIILLDKLVFAIFFITVISMRI